MVIARRHVGGEQVNERVNCGIPTILMPRLFEDRALRLDTAVCKHTSVYAVAYLLYLLYRVARKVSPYQIINRKYKMALKPANEIIFFFKVVSKKHYNINTWY